MVQRAGANKLHATATQISAHIRDFNHNPHIFQSFRSLNEIIHHTPLNYEDERWLIQNNMAFSVSILSSFRIDFQSFSQCYSFKCTYGTTEVPLILKSARDPGTPLTFMQPIDSQSVAFVPFSSPGSSSSTFPSTGYSNINTNVKELVILATSPNCPHPSLRNPEDGHFHTSDLFVELQPGRLTFRGRITEWIKSSAGLLYDAK
jgi:hypothetical protein